MFHLTKCVAQILTLCERQVAGAAAAAGLSLADVAAEAKCASEMVGTMGVALSVCTLPGQVTSERLGPGKMELGLGIVCHFQPSLVFEIRNALFIYFNNFKFVVFLIRKTIWSSVSLLSLSVVDYF